MESYCSNNVECPLTLTVNTRNTIIVSAGSDEVYSIFFWSDLQGIISRAGFKVCLISDGLKQGSVQLRFANYATLDFRPARGLGSSRNKYVFEYWGQVYKWRRHRTASDKYELSSRRKLIAVLVKSDPDWYDLLFAPSETNPDVVMATAVCLIRLQQLKHTSSLDLSISSSVSIGSRRLEFNAGRYQISVQLLRWKGFKT
ncbi:hypothetical protein V1512DRAFT_249665 [Lipomyces arxii]|uniref:uncharacterized protein n=1 Tax=Lipomyces arxii TaxID=56418 RepID=UPI0034CE040B